MTAAIECSRAAARQLLLRRTGLWTGHQSKTDTDGSRNETIPPSTRNIRQQRRATPDDVLQLISHLECVQIDPVAAVARNQHLVLGARLPGYQPELLNQLLEQHQVFEYIANAACVLPMVDYPLIQGIRRRFEAALAAEISKYQEVAAEVLRRLSREGALPASAFETNDKVHGYWDNQAPKTKATSHVLNLLNDTGTIRVVKRDGNTRFFDLAEYTIPQSIWQDAKGIETHDAERLLMEKYMRAYRIFDLSDSRFGWARWKAAERKAALSPYLSRGAVIPLAIEGCKTEYYILAEDVDELCAIERKMLLGQERSVTVPRKATSVTVAGRDIRFLPPLDNLLWRRGRVLDLFSFDYKWEIYTPVEKRTYGYYTMPILAGDRLIGRIDPKLDRTRGVLEIQSIYLEPAVRPTKLLAEALETGLRRFARLHGAKDIDTGVTTGTATDKTTGTATDTTTGAAIDISAMMKR
jgi:uncharacterized protein